MSADLYDLLEVDRSASQDDLKKAYRRLARQLHPDANPGDAVAEAKFKEVSQAYEILSDPERRAHYDTYGADLGQGGNPFGGGSVQDIFNMFFGGGQGGFGGFGGGGGFRRGPQPGPDAEKVMDITLLEAAEGVTRDVSATLPVRCVSCDGSGAAPGTGVVTCDGCKGSGEIRQVRQTLLGQMVQMGVCSRCQGFGTRIETPCTDCRGEGRRTETVTISVPVPAGVEDGSTMRLNNKGPAGVRGGANGTLYVHLRVAPDDRFERDGDDLHHEATIAYTQAVLGTTITVPTLHGDTTLEVAPGSSHGTVLRVPGEGVTHLRHRGKGDLFVHLAIEVPNRVDDETERLLRELAAHRDEAVGEGYRGLFHRRSSRK